MGDKSLSTEYWVPQFRARSMFVPNQDNASGSCAQISGTSSKTGSLYVNVLGYDEHALNVMFALTCAAFARPGSFVQMWRVRRIRTRRLPTQSE